MSVFFIPLYVVDVILILDSKNFHMCLYELHSDLKRIVCFFVAIFLCCFNIAVSHRWRWLKRLMASRGLSPCSRILMHHFISFLVLSFLSNKYLNHDYYPISSSVSSLLFFFFVSFMPRAILPMSPPVLFIFFFSAYGIVCRIVTRCQILRINQLLYHGNPADLFCFN